MDTFFLDNAYIQYVGIQVIPIPVITHQEKVCTICCPRILWREINEIETNFKPLCLPQPIEAVDID